MNEPTRICVWLLQPSPDCSLFSLLRLPSWGRSRTYPVGPANCLCCKCSNEVVLAKTPTANGSTGPARPQVGVPSSRPGFSNTWLSGSKLATKSLFSHFCLHVGKDQADVHSSGGDKMSPFLREGSRIHLTRHRSWLRGTPNSVLLFLGLSTWDMRGHEVLQGILTRPVVTEDGHGGNLKRKQSDVPAVCGQSS